MDLATFRDVCRSMIIKITAVIEEKKAHDREKARRQGGFSMYAGAQSYLQSSAI